MKRLLNILIHPDAFTNLQWTEICFRDIRRQYFQLNRVIFALGYFCPSTFETVSPHLKFPLTQSHTRAKGVKINWGWGGLCIEYKVTLLFYKNAVNYKYMYNFVYLFFLTSLVLLFKQTILASNYCTLGWIFQP